MAGILQWCSNAGTPLAATSALKTILEDSGANAVTLRTQTDALPGDMSPYALHVIDLSCTQPELGAAAKLKDSTLGIYVLNGSTILVDLAILGGSPTSATANNLTIVLDTHPLANGLANGTHTMMPSSQSWLQNTASVADIRVAQRGGGSSSYVLAGYEAGGSGNSDFVMPGRRVWFGVSAAGLAVLNTPGLGLLLNAAEWTGEFGAYSGGALTAGAITVNSFTQTSVDASVTEASGGTGPYTRQWHISTSTGFTPDGSTAVSGGTDLNGIIGSLTAATTYYLKVVQTDSAAASVTTAEETFTTASAGFAAGSAQVDSIDVHLEATAPSNSTGTVLYQWHRSEINGFDPLTDPEAVSGATSLTLEDTGRDPSITEYYVLVAEDNNGAGDTVVYPQITRGAAGSGSGRGGSRMLARAR